MLKKESNQLETIIAERTKVTATIIDKVRRSQDINTIFKVTTQEMRQALQSDRVIIYQFNSDWSGQVVAESVASGWISLLIESDKNEIVGGGHLKGDRCLLRNWSYGEQGDITKVDTFLQETQGGKYTNRQQFTAVDDIYTQGFSDCYIESLEKYQAKAYLIVPIFQHEILWGLFATYQNNGVRVWNQLEIDLTIQVANHLAVAVQQAEYVNRLQQKTINLEKTLKELQQTQQQLIQQEKLAALGQLIAGIAHEINTPLGAIQASASNNTKASLAAIADFPELSQYLTEEETEVFSHLIEQTVTSKMLFSSKEKRSLKRQITKQLKEYNIDNPRQVADILIYLGVYENIDDYFCLLQHSQVNFILDVAYNLTSLVINNRTILTSVEKASKVVFALKNYARFDQSDTKQLVSITDGIETILQIYHNQLKQNIEVIRNYQNNSLIWCYPDELIQVWTNLIHNSIQAMKQGGTLTITTKKESNGIQITIMDSGCGIPTNIRERIFEPFFTTKPTGEGSGLGLHICQKIIDKHQGNIAVESEPGTTIFSIWLPFGNQQ
ncbi:Multi-sensor signal transduction histidine kinase [Hyella patelloides LEGE 07179]|uniref:histidine kinase n=2 Tax=Hyella TaxID=945733 RepID=A0A563VNB9_9CYAN|nr:Multi-sensor signal transduction histidine kinase [Hyella patelloides LEGE 07179]